MDEVDAYENPTELFQNINNGDIEKAIEIAACFPEEIQTWVSSRGFEDGEGSDVIIRWRYLPLHLVCLNPKPSKRMIGLFLSSFPKGAKLRDHNGNLPIHYIFSEGCCDDTEILDMMVDGKFLVCLFDLSSCQIKIHIQYGVYLTITHYHLQFFYFLSTPSVYPKIMKKRDGKGRLIEDIVKESKNISRKVVDWVYRRKANELKLRKDSNEMNVETNITESHDEYSNNSALMHKSFEQKEQRQESSLLRKDFTESSDECNNTSERVRRKTFEEKEEKPEVPLLFDEHVNNFDSASVATNSFEQMKNKPESMSMYDQHANDFDKISVLSSHGFEQIEGKSKSSLLLDQCTNIDRNEKHEVHLTVGKSTETGKSKILLDLDEALDIAHTEKDALQDNLIQLQKEKSDVEKKLAFRTSMKNNVVEKLKKKDEELKNMQKYVLELEEKVEKCDKDQCKINSLKTKIKLDTKTIEDLKDVVSKFKLEADSESVKKANIEINSVKLNSEFSVLQQKSKESDTIVLHLREIISDMQLQISDKDIQLAKIQDDCVDLNKRLIAKDEENLLERQVVKLQQKEKASLQNKIKTQLGDNSSDSNCSNDFTHNELLEQNFEPIKETEKNEKVESNKNALIAVEKYKSLENMNHSLVAKINNLEKDQEDLQILLKCASEEKDSSRDNVTSSFSENINQVLMNKIHSLENTQKDMQTSLLRRAFHQETQSQKKVNSPLTNNSNVQTENDNCKSLEGINHSVLSERHSYSKRQKSKQRSSQCKKENIILQNNLRSPLNEKSSSSKQLALRKELLDICNFVKTF